MNPMERPPVFTSQRPSVVQRSGSTPTLPASKGCHHTGRGGLLEHSLDVAEGAQRATESMGMSPLQREATVLTALLHDIGKVLLHSRDGYRIPGDAKEHAILLDFALAQPMAHLKEQDLDAYSALWQVIDGYKRKDRYAAPFAALIESLDSVSAQTDVLRARSAMHGGYRLPGCNRKTLWQPLNR
ncbi:HD domain-containing protein [Thiohalospira halophila DSM 15071]|uniref:HD domain-containing protein n=1 Tax=Thiohalospira halophila DSM 15071 TaxID=1123397 RepID=A0A1I1WL97_9GAMM|nr:HD domain-containing protein [Thiohalospira halophila]SFD95906.1 HD domain-containing protein [Thiohalospira halophila DSM 15071]